jgi:transmembrane sensor
MTRATERNDDEITQQALHWHAAAAREDCDWQQFTAWLEASPRHRVAYDEVALLEEQVGRHAGALLAVDFTAADRRWRRAWIGAAVAAGAALLAVFAWQAVPSYFADDTRLFTAQAGGPATLSLAGGVQVMLAPGSSLTVAGRHDERIGLDGSAWFDVPHDPRRQLEIAAGAFRVRDIGTRFEVVNEGAQLKVVVADGAVDVLLPQRAQAVQVTAGHRLLVAGDPPIAETGAAAAAEFAGWREGRLVFRNEPLSLVAPQLGRHAGLTVTVDPSVAQRRFSGVLASSDGAQLVAQLARIMDLREQRDGDAVRLLAADGEPAGR